MYVTHGSSGRPEYYIWNAMIQRCHNPNSRGFKDYGAKGIKVCKRWRLFANFFVDMGTRPSPKHSIERVKNKKGYSPENCRWATRVEQHRNRSDNHRLRIDGETITIAEWSERTGIPASVISKRIHVLGWDGRRAVMTPLNIKPRYKFTHDGLTLSTKEWSERTGIPAAVIIDRINSRGWTIEQALTTPVLTGSERGQRSQGKMTPDMVREMRALKGKLTLRELGKRFGVAPAYAWRVLARRVWKEI